MIRKTLKEYKQRWLKNKKTWAIFGLVIVLGLPLAIFLAFVFAFHGRVYPKVSVCQLSLKGKTSLESQAFLSSFLEKNFPLKFELLSPEQKFSLELQGLKYLPQQTAQRAQRVGRGRLSWAEAKKFAQLLHQGENLVFDFQIDSIWLETQIASVAASLYQPAIDPEIKLITQGQQKKVVVETGTDGQEVNIRVLNQKVNQALACPQEETKIEIPLIILSPKISSSAAETARHRAEAFLDKKIILKLEEQTWTVNDEELISFLDFGGGFDSDKISEFGQSLAKTINTEPENATFKFENNRVVLFRPSKDGITLKEKEFLNDFFQALKEIEASAKDQEMVLPISKKPAQISTGDANSLGIKELLGRGTSIFRGSIPNRVHNLKLASLRLSGILIAPGEEFSFNKSLGDVSAATGYKQAYIIKEGRTILGDGGGVCQVSTTLFRAILKAGLPVTERQAHAYRVSYYEQDMGPGFDATVFQPSPDLKFKNNTPAHILIQTSVDLTNQKLIFDLYGTKDGRKVEISKVRLWDRQPPPPDLYQDDPTLPLGTIKQIEHKSWGAKAAFDYRVARGNEVLAEKTFYSFYQPWQAVYLRGTGQ